MIYKIILLPLLYGSKCDRNSRNMFYISLNIMVMSYGKNKKTIYFIGTYPYFFKY